MFAYRAEVPPVLPSLSEPDPGSVTLASLLLMPTPAKKQIIFHSLSLALPPICSQVQYWTSGISG